jgi:hypothetical protein
VAEWGEGEFLSGPPDSANNLARLAGNGVGALHQSEIAVCRSVQQGLKIGAGVFGNAHVRLVKRERPALWLG